MTRETEPAKRKGAFSISLRLRLIGLILLAVTPAFGLAIYTSNNQRTSARADAKATVQREAAVVAGQQQDLLTTSRNVMAALANLPVLSASPSDCSDFLASLFRNGASYLAIRVLDERGDAVCGSFQQQLGQNYAATSWFTQAVSTRGFITGGYSFETLTGKPFLTVAYPIQDRGGKIIRVLSADLSFVWMLDAFRSSDLPARSSLGILDSTGSYLADYSRPNGTTDSAPDSRIANVALQKKAAGAVESQGPDGVNRLYGFAMMPGSFPGHEAYILAGYPRSAAYASSNRILRYSLISLAIAAALAAAIAWFGRDLFVLQHMKALYATAIQLENGNFSARTRVPHTRDEVGLLAQTIDDMAGSLENALSERDAFESSLERANDELVRQAAIDPVTAVMSRREIYRRLRMAIDESAAKKRQLTVCMADIDRFKLVNDRHGHLEGDEVLKQTADALAIGGAIVGRFGGDEFLVILPGAGDHEAYVSDVRKRLNDSGSRTGVSISLSMGFAFFPADGSAIDGLIKVADDDMYSQKLDKRTAA